MTIVALAVIGIGAFLLLCKLLWDGKPPSKNTRIIVFASIALIVVLGALVALARVHVVVAAITMLIPFIRQIGRILLSGAYAYSFFRQFRGLVGNPFRSSSEDSSQNIDSETQTSELTMKLNHQTGTMSGTVLSGDYEGRDLDSLTDEELSTFYGSLQIEESKRLLEAYVARHRPHLNESSNDSNSRADSEQMSVKRAADILGVDVSAAKEDIIAAHRRLMDKLHPDKGGSSYLAAELNEAKQVMLGALG